MSGGSLQVVIDGQLQCAEPSSPIVSSAAGRWAGFALERSTCQGRAVDNIYFPSAELVLVRCGSIRVDHGSPRRFTAKEGSVTLWPARYESTGASWAACGTAGNTVETLRIQLDDATLSRLITAAPSQACELNQQSALHDPCLVSLMQLMEAEVAADCPSGALYAESLSLALLAYLSRRFATRAITPPSRGALTQPMLGRVLDHMRANLTGNLSIAEVARVANLSPHHFSARFKLSLGMAPHQWIIRARIEEGARLLRTTPLSIAQVSLSVGFGSQSHFCHAFRRWMGTTPRKYQQARSA